MDDDTVARPFALDSAAGRCFAWWHPPQGTARNLVVVMCPALGYEASCAYQPWLQLARSLAAAGLGVLRFDWYRSGDSAGDGGVLDLASLRASADAAIDEAQRLSGCSRVALAGLRMGGLLAMDAAARRGGVDALLAWAPCTGKGFVRELRALAMARGAMADASIRTGSDGVLEAQGLLLDAQSQEAFKALAPGGLDARPAPRVLLVARDDVAGSEAVFEEALRRLGSHTTTVPWPGYGAMVAEPTHPVDVTATLESVTGWLRDQGETQAHAAGEALPEALIATPTATETPWAFGAGGRLFGILSLPRGSAALSAPQDSAAILLNVGGNCRVGPHRLYVTLARTLAASGMPVLRMDVAGLGDSPGEFPHTAAMWQRATADVQAAMDSLQPLGLRRFHLVGICSGSYLALETALVDARVCSQVLGNTRVLEYETGTSPWQGSMERHYKSMRYYTRALRRVDVWGKLARGKVDVQGIAARVAMVAQARLSRAFARLLGRPTAEGGLLRKFRHLSRRGTRSLIVMSEQDDGLDYLDFHLGRNAAWLRGEPGFALQLVPGADHTFSTQAMQQQLASLIQRELLDSPAEADAKPVIAPRVAPV